MKRKKTNNSWLIIYIIVFLFLLTLGIIFYLVDSYSKTIIGEFSFNILILSILFVFYLIYYFRKLKLTKHNFSTFLHFILLSLTYVKHNFSTFLYFILISLTYVVPIIKLLNVRIPISESICQEFVIKRKTSWKYSGVIIEYESKEVNIEDRDLYNILNKGDTIEACIKKGLLGYYFIDEIR